MFRDSNDHLMKFQEINNKSKQCTMDLAFQTLHYLNYPNTKYIWYLKQWQIVFKFFDGGL